MDKSAKSQWREEIVNSFDKAQAVYVTQFGSANVEALTNLRRQLRGANADYQVVKNTIAKKALTDRSENVISDLFVGQIACVFAYGDVAAAAKVLTEFLKTNDKIKLIGGVMEGQKLSTTSVQALASLPSKEVLISRIVGSLVSPHRGLLGIFQGVPRALVSVLNQIKEKKAEAS